MLTVPEEQEQSKSKGKKWQEITKIGAEISKMETKVQCTESIKCRVDFERKLRLAP